MDFGEKTMEWSPKHGKDIPVWQSPKYKESKAKAEEIINSQKYGVQTSDFWILMNVTKSEKMAYTGLIISHNGCLKINDCLESKFDPSCVSLDKDGYKGSLVYTYCNKDQGIYEVGEVSQANCKNEYPYAMAYKRLFDRVVLKLSKLAYAGIYSDSEADEFTQQLNAPEDKPKEEDKPKAATKPEEKKPAAKKPEPIICECCGNEIQDTNVDGKTYSGAVIAARAVTKYGVPLCYGCLTDFNQRAKEDQGADAQ